MREARLLNEIFLAKAKVGDIVNVLSFEEVKSTEGIKKEALEATEYLIELMDDDGDEIAGFIEMMGQGIDFCMVEPKDVLFLN